MLLNFLRDQKYLAYLYLFTLSFLIYLPSLKYDFTYDDIGHVVINPYILNQHSFWEIFGIFNQANYPGDLYRPVTLLTIKFDYLNSGLNPFFYHLTNILLYGLLSLLIFKFIKVITNQAKIAFFSTVIFIIHPIHVEVVANIFNRSEILVAVFGILGLLNFYYYLVRPKILYQVLLTFFLLLAFFSKESALTLTLICPVLYFLVRRRKTIAFKHLFIGFGLIICSASYYLLIRTAVLDNSILIKGPESGYVVENPLLNKNFSERILPSLYVLGEYLRLMTLPLTLSSDYSLPDKIFKQTLYSLEGYSAIAIGLLCFLITLILIYKRLQVSFWFIWILVTFSLTINLVTPIGTLMADRLAFIPSLGLAVLITNFIIKFRTFGIIFFLYSFTLYLYTFQRLPIWENNLSLFTQMTADNYASPKAAFNLGSEQVRLGDYEGSIESFKEALFRDPTYTVAAKQLIYSYAKLLMVPEFRYWSFKYLSINPDDLEIDKLVEEFNQSVEEEKNK